MFGEPVRPPPRANIIPLIWTYLIKTDCTKKAQYVCNGSPNRKGYATTAHIYAAALEQSGAHTFWPIAALHKYGLHGTDTTNSFAEAPPPKTPLYVTIDGAFKSWWEDFKTPVYKSRQYPPHTTHITSPSRFPTAMFPAHPYHPHWGYNLVKIHNA